MPETELREPEAAWPTMAWGHRVLTWLKAHERTVLLGAVGFQLLVLTSMILLRATTLIHGDTVVLRVVPVDPRSMFRGEYVILSYEFSRTPLSAIEGLPAYQPGRNEQDWQGRTVSVWLEPEMDGQHWHAEKVSTQPPAAGTYLRGTIVGRNRLKFGIESYFVQEGQGRRYEEAMRNRRLSAEIAVTADGDAALRGLRIE